MWKELIKKIELQSILVLFITLLFGFFLLRASNNLSTPAGVLGSVSIAIGLLYTFGSFFTNQLRESYKDVLEEYKSMVAALKSSTRHIQNQYKQTLSDKKSTDTIEGGYSVIQNSNTETEKE